MSPLNEDELDLATTGQTYNELCDQLGITDAETLKLADRYDGYDKGEWKE